MHPRDIRRSASGAMYLKHIATLVPAFLPSSLSLFFSPRIKTSYRSPPHHPQLWTSTLAALSAAFQFVNTAHCRTRTQAMKYSRTSPQPPTVPYAIDGMHTTFPKRTLNVCKFHGSERFGHSVIVCKIWKRGIILTIAIFFSIVDERK